MRKTKTARGFGIRKFKDVNGVECSVQESSSGDNIWLGACEIGLAVGYPWREISDAEIKAKFGAEVIQSNRRMHLNIKQVKELIPILQKFVESGEI